MLDSRLPLALDGGGLEWPESGTIAVFAPSVDADLDGIPKGDEGPCDCSWPCYQNPW